MKINYYIFLILSGIWFVSLSFCKKNQNQDNTAIALLFLSGSNQNQAVINRYAELAYKIYAETYQKVLNLEIAVDSFVSDPGNQDKLMEVRNAWLEARKKYLLTQTLRFSDGPIDNPDILSDDVHSCFSDTTNYDFYYNLLGIKIFYTGDYNSEDGPGE